MAPTSVANSGPFASIALVSEDARGEIYAITLPGDQELMLLHSKAGSLRGGHSHDVPEVVLMLSGRMRYHKLDSHPIDLVAGDASFNQVGLVHMGEALSDLWLVEWKIGATKNGWSNTDYEPWRARVRASR